MPRIRTIKPEFFFDEDLAKLSDRTRLFFIGLFTQADKGGKMEDRPERLKANIFPYKSVDADAMLNELSPNFITRYEVNARKYLKINSFCKHQRPHHTESNSVIPEPNGELPVVTPIIAGRKGREGNGEGKGMEKGKESVNLGIPEDLKSNEQDILTWLDYKREKGQTYKPKGLSALWVMIRKIPAHLRKASIEQSMANNWAGIFPVKGDFDGKSKGAGSPIPPGKYAGIS